MLKATTHRDSRAAVFFLKYLPWILYAVVLILAASGHLKP